MTGTNRITLIMARARDGTIGDQGKLPWHILSDLRRFKQFTMGLPMIMGRKTFDSLPGLLEGRRHIVITRDPDWDEEGAVRARDVAEALRLANAPHVAVIGGAQIYNAFLPKAQRIELTEIDADYAGDTAIDAPDAREWEETAREDHPAEGKHPAFSFVSYKRRAAPE